MGELPILGYSIMKKILFALYFFAAALTVSAQSYQDLVKQGLDAISHDSLMQAEDFFRAALKKEPALKSNALLFNYIGQIQEKTGRDTEALESYNLGINLSPHTMGILLNRAALYMRIGRMDKALTDYSDVLDLNPDHRHALMMRAYIYTSQNLFKDARSDYEHLLRIEPDNDDAVLGLILLNEKDNRPKEAMDQINQLIQKKPRCSDYYVVRAEMEMNRKAYESAELDYMKAIELDPENVICYLNRAAYYIKTGQKEKARQDLKKAGSLNADPGELADLYQQLED